jgi:hypothetical protein
VSFRTLFFYGSDGLAAGNTRAGIGFDFRHLPPTDAELPVFGDNQSWPATRPGGGLGATYWPRPNRREVSRELSTTLPALFAGEPAIREAGVKGRS